MGIADFPLGICKQAQVQLQIWKDRAQQPTSDAASPGPQVSKNQQGAVGQPDLKHSGHTQLCQYDNPYI